MLQACIMGFGGVAMRAMAGEEKTDFVDPLAPNRAIFLGLKRSFSYGRWSFSWTPSITSRLLGSTGRIERSLGNLPRLNSIDGKVLKSPWEFKQRGRAQGLGIDLFPHLAKEEVIDEISMVKSMARTFRAYLGKLFYIRGMLSRPSEHGGLAGYGLGTKSDLPGSWCSTEG